LLARRTDRERGVRNYSDGDLTKFVEAYWEVAQERMRHEEAHQRKGIGPADYSNVLERYAVRNEQAVPANENRLVAASSQTEMSRSTAMTESPEVQVQADLIAAFNERVDKLRREGVNSYPPLGGMNHGHRQIAL
jgi:hypothetical protein